MLSALLGGVLIGLAASLFWFANHRTAGISGLVRDALHAGPGQLVSIAFLAGLVIAGLVAGFTGHASLELAKLPLARLAVGGVLVGFGTTISNGCTSGHGVCGISRGSVRSIVGTATFVAAGIVTVFVFGHVLKGTLQ